MLDRLALSSTMLALHLHLLEDTWRQHMLLNHNAMSAAMATSINLPIRTSRAFALLTNLLLLELEFRRMPIVEIL
jgi:hypothetical protein